MHTSNTLLYAQNFKKKKKQQKFSVRQRFTYILRPCHTLAKTARCDRAFTSTPLSFNVIVYQLKFTWNGYVGMEGNSGASTDITKVFLLYNNIQCRFLFFACPQLTLVAQN